MDQITIINPHIHALPETGLNPALPGRVSPGDRETQLNPQVAAFARVSPGTMLCGDYLVESQISVPAGEADVYLCSREGKRYAAKVYRRSFSLKEQVAQALKGMNNPWVAAPVALGQFRDRTVEITPYYPEGSLRGKTFGFQTLKERIIPCINEGLKALHDANILHKDLKPSNIVLTGPELQVSIIDFGISSPIYADSTVVVTKTGMTPEYCAPETFKGLFSTHADYYSLGMTIYELYCGKTPYRDMDPEEIEKYLVIQRLPFPEDMPKQLQDLIRALTYPDISNRNSKDNPNRRWGYEEVKKWLEDVPQTIPGEGIHALSDKPYRFAEAEYSDVRLLVKAMAENWSEGKKHLFRGLLTSHFQECDPHRARLCREAELEAAESGGRDDFIFWKTLYALAPECQDFIWKGKTYSGLSAFGREILERLRAGDYKLNTYLDSLFREGILGHFVSLREPGNEAMLDAVQALERRHMAAADSHGRKVNYYLTGYLLSGQRVLLLGGEEFHTIGELTEHMHNLLGPNNQFLDRLRYFCHLMVDRYGNLVPELESWLLALGKQEALEIWRRKMQENPS